MVQDFLVFVGLPGQYAIAIGGILLSLFMTFFFKYVPVQSKRNKQYTILVAGVIFSMLFVEYDFTSFATVQVSLQNLVIMLIVSFAFFEVFGDRLKKILKQKSENLGGE